MWLIRVIFAYWLTGLARCTGLLNWHAAWLTGLARCTNLLDYHAAMAYWTTTLHWLTGLTRCTGLPNWHAALAYWTDTPHWLTGLTRCTGFLDGYSLAHIGGARSQKMSLYNFSRNCTEVIMHANKVIPENLVTVRVRNSPLQYKLLGNHSQPSTYPTACDWSFY